MISVVQRARSAHVIVGAQEVGRIGAGLLVLVGAVRDDGERDADCLAQRLATLRLFSDDEGRMNLSLRDIDGAVLVVSQFTLAADTRKGRRPSFARAMPPATAEGLVTRLVEGIRGHGLEVETGSFGAEMQVHLVNDGPVTLLLDSRPPSRVGRPTDTDDG
jgi:D-tyrosyl-tRNA(Tyr) deacylase